MLKEEVKILIEGRIGMEADNKLLNRQMRMCFYVVDVMLAVVLMLI